MRRHLFWRTTEVSDHQGGVYGYRLREAMDCPGVGLGDTECQDKKGLATGLKVLAEDRGCKRIMVPVGVQSVEHGWESFVGEVMALPKSLRSRLTIEVHGLRTAVSQGCAELAQMLQDDGLVSVAAWVRCGESEFVEEVMATMSPSILAVERGDCRKALTAKGREDFLDTLEIANGGGALVLVDGVDCEQDFRAMRDVGVDLLHGNFWGKMTFTEESRQVGGLLPASFNRRGQESARGEYA